MRASSQGWARVVHRALFPQAEPRISPEAGEISTLIDHFPPIHQPESVVAVLHMTIVRWVSMRRTAPWGRGEGNRQWGKCGSDGGDTAAGTGSTVLPSAVYRSMSRRQAALPRDPRSRSRLRGAGPGSSPVPPVRRPAGAAHRRAAPRPPHCDVVMGSTSSHGPGAVPAVREQRQCCLSVRVRDRPDTHAGTEPGSTTPEFVPPGEPCRPGGPVRRAAPAAPGHGPAAVLPGTPWSSEQRVRASASRSEAS
jgi:hypothetical protein